MHVAFFSPAWPLARSQNGIVTYLHWMKPALEREGHRVSIFAWECFSREPDLYPVRRRLPVSYRVARRLSRRRSASFDVFELSAPIAIALERVARRTPIDIVEMEESFGWFADVARRTSLPTVARLHGPAFLSLIEHELESPFAREKIEREGEALRNFPAITSPAARTLAQTVERYRLEPKRAVHIVNPVAMHLQTPVWRLNACDRNRILFVGRFDLRKGADIALRAFRKLLEIRPEASLTFVGPDSGLPHPDGAPVHIGQYCDSLFPGELRDRIDYRGPLPNEEVARLRAKAMVTLVASRWENAGYSMLEAMLQGCPLVSTDAGGCPETVIHGVNGRLAKSGDPDDFAAQLYAMLADPEAAEAMGDAARRHVLEKHSPACVAAESLAFYARILKSDAG